MYAWKALRPSDILAAARLIRRIVAGDDVGLNLREHYDYGRPLLDKKAITQEKTSQKLSVNRTSTRN